jgi:hypothetical protein
MSQALEVPATGSLALVEDAGRPGTRVRSVDAGRRG